MTSIQSKIQEAAEKNNSLLQGLQETDGAPAQLKQQNEYIKDLDHQIASTDQRVKSSRRKAHDELQDHEKYRDSTVRRFAHKISGRKEQFAEKAAKEEKEYFDAIQAQKTAEDELAYVKQLRAEAEIGKVQMVQRAERHSALQAELDALYDSIFAGYTPEFPDEDRKEEACNIAFQQIQDLNQKLERARHVLFLLGQVAHKLSEARNRLDDAYGMSQYDMFGGGTFASMQKRNYIEQADSSIQQVRMLQQQVKQAAPDIPHLGDMNIRMNSIWSDVIFDNIFTDMEMHDEIKKCIAQVDHAGKTCGQIVRQRENVERNIQQDVQRMQQTMRQARVELQQAREDAFRRVLGGEQTGVGLGSPPPGETASTDAPPPYAPPAYSA